MNDRSLKKNQYFLQALQEASEQEYGSARTSQEVFLSEGFKAKMFQLIRKQKKGNFHYTKIRRRIIAVAVALMVFFVTAMSIGAVRKPVIEYIKKVFDLGTDFTFSYSGGEGMSPTTIETAYTFQKVPEGYALSSKNDLRVFISQMWTHKNGDILELTQYTASGAFTLNTEDAIEKTVKIGEYEGTLYTHPERQFLLWHTEEYIFYIILLSDVDTITNGSIDLVELASNLVMMETE